MPQISSISSQGNSSLNSTMDLLGNQGSTTVRITAQQVVAGAWSTATGDIVYASSASSVSALTIGSSEQILHVSAGIPAWKDSSVFLSTILTAAGDILIRSSGGITRLAGASSAGYLKYSTVDGAIGPSWATLDAGEIPVQTTAAGGTTSIQVPSSGAVLAYSTVDGAVGPDWIVLDPGELLTVTSAAVTTGLAIPSSGSILRYSTVDGTVGPAWVIMDPTEILVGTSALAIGTSEQVLTVTDGAVAWENAAAGGSGGSTGRSLPAQVWSPTADASSFASATLTVVQSGASVPSPRWYQWNFSSGTAREYITVQTILPPTYNGTPSIDVYAKSSQSMGVGTSKARFGCAVSAVTPGDDIDFDGNSFDGLTNIVETTVFSTAGDMQKLNIPLTSADSMIAGDLITLALFRDTTNSSEDHPGTIEFLGAELRWTS